MIHLQCDHHQNLQSLHPIQDRFNFLFVELPLQRLDDLSTLARDVQLGQQHFEFFLKLVQRSILGSKVSDGLEPGRINVLSFEMEPQFGEEILYVRSLDGASDALLGAVFDIAQILEKLGGDRKNSNDAGGDAKRVHVTGERRCSKVCNARGRRENGSMLGLREREGCVRLRGIAMQTTKKREERHFSCKLTRRLSQAEGRCNAAEQVCNQHRDPYDAACSLQAEISPAHTQTNHVSREWRRAQDRLRNTGMYIESLGEVGEDVRVRRKCCCPRFQLVGLGSAL
jgi:hypothetical protein